MRGGLRVIVRQAWRNLRARPGQALLILVTMSLATTTLAMAIAINKTGDNAWTRVWQGTHGGDVIAWAGYDTTAIPPNAPSHWVYQQLDAVRTAPGVRAVGGPYADLTATGRIGVADDVKLSVSVRDPAPAAIDQPMVTSGQWLTAGSGVVLEDALATILGVRVGDSVVISGQRLPVVGTAVSTSAPRYRPGHYGYAWVNQSTAAALQAGGALFQGATMPIRLTNPSTSDSFARTHQAAAAFSDPSAGFEVDTPADVLAGQHEDLNTLAVALLVVGTALALTMIAITAVLVSARVAAHTRQIGTLKAIGVTPMQLAAIVLVENVAVALTAAVVGVFAGDHLAPLLDRTETVLYGAPHAPAVSATTIALVGTVALCVVMVATVRPVVLGVRATTLRALTPAARAPRGAGLRVPGPRAWQIGLRSLLRRPTRTISTVIGGALAIAVMTIAVALRTSQAIALAHNPHDAANRALLGEIRGIVVTAGVAMIALALVNAAIVATLAARDSARSYAIMRTLGATPGQTAASFLCGQLTSAVLAVALGIPAGIGVFNALRRGLDAVQLSLSTVATLTFAALVAYLAIAAVPALVLARRPVAPQLAYE